MSDFAWRSLLHGLPLDGLLGFTFKHIRLGLFYGVGDIVDVIQGVLRIDGRHLVALLYLRSRFNQPHKGEGRPARLAGARYRCVDVRVSPRGRLTGEPDSTRNGPHGDSRHLEFRRLRRRHIRLAVQQVQRSARQHQKGERQ